MDDSELIRSFSARLEHANNNASIIQILETLQSMQMTVGTLKETRIGIIVNKLTKRDDLSSAVHKLSWALVDQWKKMANSAIQQKQYNQSTVTNIPLTVDMKDIKPTQLRTKGSNKPPPNNNNNRMRNKKRSLKDSMLNDYGNNTNTNNTTNSHSHSNSNSNSLPPPMKKQRRRQTTPSNTSSMLLGLGNKRKVPSLQEICISVMKKNAMKIGKINCELSGDVVVQIYQNCNPTQLKKVYLENPQFRKHLDVLWKRQLLKINQTYKKTDKSMSYFRAYHEYKKEQKYKREAIQCRLQEKRQNMEITEKQSRTRTISRDEAMMLRNKYAKNPKFRNKSQVKRSRIMQDCAAFVQRRNRMFATAAYQSNKAKREELNKQQAFIRRQKETRKQRQKEKNSISMW